MNIWIRLLVIEPRCSETMFAVEMLRCHLWLDSTRECEGTKILTISRRLLPGWPKRCLVESLTDNQWAIKRCCNLFGMLRDALSLFQSAPDSYTLADITLEQGISWMARPATAFPFRMLLCSVAAWLGLIVMSECLATESMPG